MGRTYFNLWIVFLISGLWHGAAWNFVIWGAFHGLFLVADRLFLLKVYKKIGKVPSIIITFNITLLGWVLFRAANISLARAYIRKMFSFDFAQTEILFDVKFYIILFIAIIFSFFGAFRGVEKWQERILNPDQTSKVIIGMTLIAILFLMINVGAITSTGFNPFIYFRF